jgi:hypothetical protein
MGDSVGPNGLPGDEPEMVVDLLDAHRLARKHLAHVDFAALVADPAAGGDDRRPIVERC